MDRHHKLGRRTLGAYLKTSGAGQATTREILALFGTTERTLAHEVGHAIDDLFNLQGLLLNDHLIRQELRAIADQRASLSSNESFRRYIRSKPEQVAEFVARYIAHNEMCVAMAPLAVAKFESFIKTRPTLLPLLAIRPSMRQGVAEFEAKVWVESQAPPDPHAILHFEDGMPVWIKVPPEIHRALKNLTPAEQSLVIQFMAIPANMLRKGAVLNPEFSMKNVPRDLVMAKAFNKHFTLSGWLADAQGLVTKDAATMETYQKFVAGGGVFADIGHAMMEAAQVTADDIMGKKKPFVSYMTNPYQAYKAILDNLQKVTGASENVTRFSIYRQAIDAGLSHEEAVHLARRTTLDFNRHGGWMSVRMLAQIIPFFNPALQGSEKVASTLFNPNNPNLGKDWLRVLAHITVPSLLLWALFHRDKRIQEMEWYEKNYFWHIPLPVGNKILRIPKPFEIGIAFGSVPQRLLDWAVDGDPKGMKEALKAAWGAMLPEFMPTIFKPIYEYSTNFNTFIGRAD